MLARSSKLKMVGLLVLVGVAGCSNTLEPGSPPAAVAVTRAALVTTGCDKDQIALLERAADSAYGQLFNARIAMSGVLDGNNTSRYEYWFGALDADRVETVATHFDNAFTAAPQVTYECMSSCTTSDYAISIWTNPGQVSEFPTQLCPIYFDLRQPYWEVSVGVLIHEYMHYVGFVDQHNPFCDPELDHQLAADPNAALLDPEAYRLFALDWTPGDPFKRVDYP